MPSHILGYLRVVYRRRWIVAAIFLIVLGGVATYNATAARIYEAHATILIDANEPHVVAFEKVVQEGGGDYYQTQQELLQSVSLAQHTVAMLDLAKRPGFGGSEQAAIGSVRAGLRISPVRGSRLVNVRFRSPDPALAAEIANAHARAYIEQTLENRYVVSSEATEWLDAQLAEERKRVQQADAALQTYREEHDALSLKDGQGIVVQKLADLNAAVTRAKTDRIEKEAEYRELAAIGQNAAALDSVPAILANPFIQQLKGDLATLQRDYAQLSESLGERHPLLLEKHSAVENVENRLAAEVTRVVDSVHRSYLAAQAEERSLMRALEEQKSEALSLNRRGIEYAALERESESVRQVYQSLLQRAKETGVARDLRATNTRLIDRAQAPTSPISPRPMFNLLMALLSGSLLAFAAVCGVELLDDRVKTPDDLKGHLRAIPFLGLLPELPAKRGDVDRLMNGNVPASFTEAVRSMRTAILSAVGDRRERQSILVASAGEGEGKTLVACNLAMALAQGQRRVLLIDADMRRPNVNTMLDLPLAPGLSDVLAGSASLSDVLRPTGITGLTVVTAGVPSDQASELLGSAIFGELFDIMQEHFEWVIVDSPPVLTVTDASIVARLTTGVVLVVGSGMTSSRAMGLAVEELQRANGHVIGSILNRADLKNHPFYFAPYSRGQYRTDRPMSAPGSRS